MSAMAILVVIAFVILMLSVVLAIGTNSFLNPTYLAVFAAALLYVGGAFLGIIHG